MVLDLEEKVEAQLAESASQRGVDPSTLAAELVRQGLQQELERRAELRRSVDSKLPSGFWERAATIDNSTLAARDEALRVLATFAIDRNINLQPGMSVDDLIAEDRR